MTERIRWTAVECGTVASWFGYAGSAEPALFSILHPVASKPGRHRYDEWALCATFPGAESEARYAGSREPEAAVAELKAEAERWLEEFASSLGAVFPADAYEFPEDDELLEVKFAAGTRVRFAHPDAGYPGEAEEAMKVLTPGRVYTIAWADIGQSRTDLNLADKGKSLGRFNSVLFEPVDDEVAASPAAGEE